MYKVEFSNGKSILVESYSEMLDKNKFNIQHIVLKTMPSRYSYTELKEVLCNGDITSVTISKITNPAMPGYEANDVLTLVKKYDDFGDDISVEFQADMKEYVIRIFRITEASKEAKRQGPELVAAMLGLSETYESLLSQV